MAQRSGDDVTELQRRRQLAKMDKAELIDRIIRLERGADTQDKP